MTSAIPIPTTPKRFPARAVSCFDRPANARMKKQPGDDNVGTLDQGEGESSLDVLIRLEHLEHSGGHGEATEDVDARDEDADEGDHRDPQSCPHGPPGEGRRRR